MGDGRTYDYTLALRAVTTSDFMTADWARIPYDVLDHMIRKSPHIVVALDDRGVPGAGLDDIGVDGPLGQEIHRTHFLFEVCHAAGDWTMDDYKRSAIAAVREKVGNGRVLLALSGGVDSSVCAALLAEAVGEQLTCVFVDHRPWSVPPGRSPPAPSPYSPRGSSR